MVRPLVAELSEVLMNARSVLEPHTFNEWMMVVTEITAVSLVARQMATGMEYWTNSMAPP